MTRFILTVALAAVTVSAHAANARSLRTQQTFAVDQYRRAQLQPYRPAPQSFSYRPNVVQQQSRTMALAANQSYTGRWGGFGHGPMQYSEVYTSRKIGH